MTTREIYFKNVLSSDLPSGLIFYIHKDKNGTIQLGNSICLKFKTDEDTVKESVKAMKKIEQSDGFMFWNMSPEGEGFFSENWSTIVKGITKNIK